LEGSLAVKANRIFDCGSAGTNFALDLVTCARQLELAEKKRSLTDSEFETLLQTHWNLWESFRQTGNSQMYEALFDLKKKYADVYERFLAVDEDFIRTRTSHIEKDNGGLFAGFSMDDLDKVSLEVVKALPGKVITDWKNYGGYLSVIETLLQKRQTPKVRAEILDLYKKAEEIEDRYQPIGLGSYLLMKLVADFPKLGKYVNEKKGEDK
jgi:hypothetical protein